VARVAELPDRQIIVSGALGRKLARPGPRVAATIKEVWTYIRERSWGEVCPDVSRYVVEGNTRRIEKPRGDPHARNAGRDLLDHERCRGAGIYY
jgi:hypothetical protein